MSLENTIITTAGAIGILWPGTLCPHPRGRGCSNRIPLDRTGRAYRLGPFESNSLELTMSSREVVLGVALRFILLSQLCAGEELYVTNT
jgi:hypothetical protein